MIARRDSGGGDWGHLALCNPVSVKGIVPL